MFEVSQFISQGNEWLKLSGHRGKGACAKLETIDSAHEKSVVQN